VRRTGSAAKLRNTGINWTLVSQVPNYSVLRQFVPTSLPAQPPSLDGFRRFHNNADLGDHSRGNEAGLVVEP